MAGVKGRSGGARPGTGGKREGAGRKPQPPTFSAATGSDAETFLQSVVSDVSADLKLRLEAAKALLPYQKPKMGEQGKKEAKRDAALSAGGGKFSIPSPPKLTLVKSA